MIRPPAPLFAKLFSLFVLLLSWSLCARAADEPVDRSTPRRAVSALLTAGRARDFATMKQGLDLRTSVPATRQISGERLAEELYTVLERGVVFDLEELSDDPKGNPEDGARIEVIGQIRAGDENVPLLLTSVGGRGWLVSAQTVARVPELYEFYGPVWLEQVLPQAFTAIHLGDLALWRWIGLALAVIGGLVIGWLLNALLIALTRKVAKSTKAKLDDELIRRLRNPSWLFLSLLIARGVLELLGLPARTLGSIATARNSVFIIVLAWAFNSIIGLVADTIDARALQHATASASYAGRARGVRTQVQVLRRLLTITVGVIAAALILTQFEVVRSVGMSLLASAGLAGIVLGLAAQRTIGSMLGGLQLSITQPIRVGDEIVIEGELGAVEEITLTYVVVKLWDERRLIVPVTRFLEQPFENWTKVNSSLHGTVFLPARPGLPVDAMREELLRLIRDDPRWDGRTQRIQVTDASQHTITLRVLISSHTSSALIELRHELREKLMDWLAHYEDGKYLVRGPVFGD